MILFQNPVVPRSRLDHEVPLVDTAALFVLYATAINLPFPYVAAVHDLDAGSVLSVHVVASVEEAAPSEDEAIVA